MPRHTLHILSDATGQLAAHVINPILTQFPGVDFKKVFHTFQDTAAKIEATIKTFRGKNHLVLHALVDPASKRLVSDACAKLKIPHYDLTGHLAQFISDHTGVPPANELSRLHEVDAGYFHRIEAMEFTAAHDDGRNLATLPGADLVLVGLSRVSKSPTATYLGSMGYKTANVSVTPQTGFPPELAKVKSKIVALTVAPARLAHIRADRLADFGVSTRTDYADRRSVVREVVWAEAQYRRRGYPIVDTTDMTIEKTAATILKLKKIKRAGLSIL